MALVRFNTLTLNMKEVINPTILEGSEWAFEAVLDQYDLEGLDLNLWKKTMEFKTRTKESFLNIKEFVSSSRLTNFKVVGDNGNVSHYKVGFTLMAGLNSTVQIRGFPIEGSLEKLKAALSSYGKLQDEPTRVDMTWLLPQDRKREEID